MTVASLDNCKRLHELSGWDDCYFVYQQFSGQLMRNLQLRGDEWVFAYDLGYLLRKLQYMEDLAVHRCHHMDNSWNWEAQCHPDPDASDGYSFAYADTPENALCKLAIALFEAGVLVKEETQ